MLATVYEQLAFRTEAGTWRNIYSPDRCPGASEWGPPGRPERRQSSHRSGDPNGHASGLRGRAPEPRGRLGITLRPESQGSTEKSHRIEVRNGVLIHEENQIAADAPVLTLNYRSLLIALFGQLPAALVLARDDVEASEGAESLLEAWLTMLDPLNPLFPIVTPREADFAQALPSDPRAFPSAAVLGGRGNDHLLGADLLERSPGGRDRPESALLENDAVVAQAQANARGLFAWALYRVLYHDGAYSHVVIRQAIQRDGLSPLAQASAAEALGVDLGSRLRGLAREEGRLVYSLEQFHTNLTLQDRPFLTAIFLASDDDEGTRDVLENRFGPALKAMIADEAGPAAYSV